MGASAKWKSWCAIVTACLFLLQSCATIFHGTSQKIPVTSNPAGARIVVDGKDIGITPLSLKLAKKRDHLIRVEREGYVPLEIRCLSQGGGVSAISIIGNLIWGFMGLMPGALLWTLGLIGGMFGEEGSGERMEGGELLMLLGFVGVWVGTIFLDSSLGANRKLQPEVVRVTLDKAEEGARANVVCMTLRDWQNIRWIRVACAGSNADAGEISLK